MEDVTEAVGILRDSLSMTKSIHKPLIVKIVVRASVGPSEVVRKLTGYMEDVTEAVGILRDFLSMTKSIHKPLIVKIVVRASVGPSEVAHGLRHVLRVPGQLPHNLRWSNRRPN